MSTVLVIPCHPCGDSLIAAITAAAVSALEQNGTPVRVRDLYAEGFETVDAPRQQIESSRADLEWCDTLLMIYPTWWAGQPAMLKGWIDQLFGEDRWPGIGKLIAITTHGSGKRVNALEGEGGKRTITRHMRARCRPTTRTTWIALYGVDTSTEEQRRRFIERVSKVARAIR